jgi:hypothetical protein
MRLAVRRSNQLGAEWQAPRPIELAEKISNVRRNLTSECAPPTERERGAMLIELVLAATVALLVGGAVVTTSVRQSAHRAVNLETTLAHNAITDVVARLRALPISALPALHGAGFDVPGHTGLPAGLSAVPGDPDGLPGSIQVGIEASAGTAVLYRVVLNVEWLGVAGRRRERVIGLLGERRS